MDLTIRSGNGGRHTLTWLVVALDLLLLILLENLLLPQDISTLNESAFLHEVESPCLSLLALIELVIDCRIEELSLSK